MDGSNRTTNRSCQQVTDPNPVTGAASVRAAKR